MVTDDSEQLAIGGSPGYPAVRYPHGQALPPEVAEGHNEHQGRAVVVRSVPPPCHHHVPRNRPAHVPCARPGRVWVGSYGKPAPWNRFSAYSTSRSSYRSRKRSGARPRSNGSPSARSLWVRGAPTAGGGHQRRGRRPATPQPVETQLHLVRIRPGQTAPDHLLRGGLPPWHPAGGPRGPHQQEGDAVLVPGMRPCRGAAPGVRAPPPGRCGARACLQLATLVQENPLIHGLVVIVDLSVSQDGAKYHTPVAIADVDVRHVIRNDVGVVPARPRGGPTRGSGPALSHTGKSNPAWLPQTCSWSPDDGRGFRARSRRPVVRLSTCTRLLTVGTVTGGCRFACCATDWCRGTPRRGLRGIHGGPVAEVVQHLDRQSVPAYQGPNQHRQTAAYLALLDEGPHDVRGTLNRLQVQVPRGRRAPRHGGVYRLHQGGPQAPHKGPPAGDPAGQRLHPGARPGPSRTGVLPRPEEGAFQGTIEINDEGRVVEVDARHRSPVPRGGQAARMSCIRSE